MYFADDSILAGPSLQGSQLNGEQMKRAKT
jgi:hypothetical protein